MTAISPERRAEIMRIDCGQCRTAALKSARGIAGHHSQHGKGLNMILASSGGHWATGISVQWREHAGTRNSTAFSGWRAAADFYDDGLSDDNPDTGQISTEGTLRTRHAVRDGEQTSGLTAAIDTLIADAAKLGIEWLANPTLQYEGDGESKDWPPPPEWRDLLRAQAQRIGWSTYGYEPTGIGAS